MYKPYYVLVIVYIQFLYHIQLHIDSDEYPYKCWISVCSHCGESQSPCSEHVQHTPGPLLNFAYT